MKKVLRIASVLLSICLGFLFVITTPTSTLGVENKNTPVAIDYEAVKDQLAQDVFNKINEARKKKGLTSYNWNEDIEEIANKRAKGISKCFKHNLPDGRSFEGLYFDSMIPYSYVGENIAYGYTSADSVVNAWLKHSMHRDLIYSPVFSDCTIGVFVNSSGRIYFAAEFYK